MVGNLSLFYSVYRWYSKFMDILSGRVAPAPIDPRDPLTLQTYLNRRGYWVPYTGLMDKKTKEAIKAFQRDNGLEADGIVGSKTWAILEIK